MSNLLSIHNSKNQVGIGTNNISVSSSLTIKEDSKRYIVFNTGNDSIDTHRSIEFEDETTLSTVKTHSISSPKLLYIASNSIISSLSFSSSANTYLKVSNTGGLGLVDKTASIVQSISATDGTYGFTSPNNIINITVNFNETVTVTGTPSLTLSNNASATYISGDNSTSILFRYTIQQSDTDSSSLSVSSLSGTIEDLSSNPCTTISGTLGSVIVDTTATSIVSFIISNTSLKVGETATVTLQFSESVSGFNSDADITEQNGSLATMTSSDNITWTGTFTPTDDIEDTTNILQLASSYTDSVGNSGPTAQTANYSIDTKEPILSNASSIGTTTDTTPTFTFTSSEAGIITSSLSFSTSNSAIVGGNSITFNTLSNSTYSSQWVKVTDTAGNISNALNIPSFTVAANPYSTSNIRYYMWNQNPSGYTRGDVGFVRILAGPDSNPGNLQPNGDSRGQPGSFEDWQLTVDNQTYTYGYIVMPNPSLSNTVTPTHTSGSNWPPTWGQGYNNYRYKITRQSNTGNFILENPWQGLDFDTYHITGSSTQWEFIRHSSNATNGDPLWRIKITSTSPSSYNGKYLSIRTSAETSYWWVYGKHGYGYSTVLNQRTGWSKQLWRLDFL